MSDVQPAGGSNGALDKALSVLEVLVDGAPRIRLADISAKSGLAKPNTHRILKALVRRGYARTDGAGNYEPGVQILALAGRILGTLDYARHARSALLALQHSVPTTVHFAVLSGMDIFYAEKLEARGAYRMASSVGMRLPLHCTAIGKVVLAGLPPDERDAMLMARGMPRRTPRTITDRTAFERELTKVERTGFAFDNEENEEGVRCIGAPVYGTLGRIVGGVSVSAPAFELPDKEVLAVAPLVIDAAANVSKSLGAPESIVEACRRRAALIREGSGTPVTS